jgi:hypothetical protein
MEISGHENPQKSSFGQIFSPHNEEPNSFTHTYKPRANRMQEQNANPEIRWGKTKTELGETLAHGNRLVDHLLLPR